MSAPITSMGTCPHGDRSCPCADGDLCHYGGTYPYPCPNPTTGIMGQVHPHCHIEGCTWHLEGSPGRSTRAEGECGLQKINPKEMSLDIPVRRGTIEWACGWLRNGGPAGHLNPAPPGAEKP